MKEINSKDVFQQKTQAQIFPEAELPRLIAEECERQGRLISEVADLLEQNDCQRVRTRLSGILKEHKKNIKRRNSDLREFLKQFAFASRQNFALAEFLESSSKTG